MTTGSADDTTTLSMRSPARYFEGWDHVEFWVGNARAFAGWLAGAFGFDITGYSGPETGARDRVSYVLEQGWIRLVVTGSLTPRSTIADHVKAHGDGVRDIAIRVSSAAATYDAALARGAVGVMAPRTEEDPAGKVVRATIALYGDTQHTFVERSAYSGIFLPGYVASEQLPSRPAGAPVRLSRIDHVVANVHKGTLDRWIGFYRDTLGLEQLVHFGDDQISTEYSALM